MTVGGPIRAVVFDAYGTLFDVHSVVSECEARFAGKGAQLSQMWRAKQLEYTWLRSLMGRYEDFEAITRAALGAACRMLGLQLDAATVDRLMQAYLVLKTFPELPGALKALRRCRLAILSNGSPRMLSAVVRNAGLDPLLDSVLSADALKIFKPHPSVYELATRHLRLSAREIAFVSSNFWDVAGAASFGFRTYWINRAGNQPDELGFQPTAVLSGLDELAALVAG